MTHPQSRRLRGALLRPAMRVASVLDIDMDVVRERGIKGFIFDLDDTLVCALQPTAEPGVCDWITLIREEFKIFIVSNNISHHRVNIAALHLDLPFVAQARKPSKKFFRQALAEMKLQPEEVAIVGDQLFTDVLGGNRLGAMTILVDPLSAERKWHRRMMRSLETYMLKRHGSVYHARATESAPATHHPSMGPHS